MAKLGEYKMVQVHLHSLGIDHTEVERTHWTDAVVSQRQINMFGKNALAFLVANMWCPVQPSWADGQCTEIRFIGE